MMVITTEKIPGYDYEIIGMVQGSTIQSKNMFSDIGQGLKNIVGGELKSYTDMMNKARDIALRRMMDEAKSQGADAIIGVRFMTSSIMQAAAEVMVYGTAVKLK